jgi:hypothetical protein
MITCQNVIGGQKTLVLCHGLTEEALFRDMVIPGCLLSNAGEHKLSS